MDKKRLRLPASFWLRHPLLARKIMQLALLTGAPENTEGQEVARYGPQSSAELETESHGLRRANRRTRWLLNRIDRRTQRCLKAAARAEQLAQQALRSGERFHVVGGRRRKPWRHIRTTAAEGFAVTPGEALTEAAEVHRQIQDETRLGSSIHLNCRSRAVVLIAYLLILVDAVALFTVFSFLLNIDWNQIDAPRLTAAVAFSLFGAGVMAKLAVELGRRVWAWRVSAVAGELGGEEFPPRSLVVIAGGVSLGILSVLSGASIFTRLQYEGTLADASGLAITVGLVLAASAAAAPWILVQQEAYDGSVATRTLAGLSAVVAQADVERRAARRGAEVSLAAAQGDLAWNQRKAWHIVQLAGQSYLKPQQVILLARSLWGRDGVPASIDIPANSEPRALLPIKVPPDLRRIAQAFEQMRMAIERAETRLRILAGAGSHTRDEVNH